MLEVVHVGGVEDAAVDEDPQVGGVEELDAEVEQGAPDHEVELQVDEAPAAEPFGGGVPRARPEGLGGGGESGEGAPHVPQAHQEEQRPGESVPFEGTHRLRPFAETPAGMKGAGKGRRITSSAGGQDLLLPSRKKKMNPPR